MIVPYIVTGCLFLVAAVVVLLALRRPDDFRIERSIAIGAAPATIHAAINDFRAWTHWSPWEHLDPALQRTYSGPPTGADSVYAWKGNGKVGEGRMTILDSRPGEIVRIRLEFLKPWQATNLAEFIISPEGNQARVRWIMTGKHTPGAKIFAFLFNMDKMVGRDFERGLSNLKAHLEPGA